MGNYAYAISIEHVKGIITIEEIIILNYMNKDIGILADNVYLIGVTMPEVSLGKIMKGKKFVYDEKGETYQVFNMSEYDKYVDV